MLLSCHDSPRIFIIPIMSDRITFYGNENEVLDGLRKKYSIRNEDSHLCSNDGVVLYNVYGDNDSIEFQYNLFFFENKLEGIGIYFTSKNAENNFRYRIKNEILKDFFNDIKSLFKFYSTIIL
jgi:hypothetical protein